MAATGYTPISLYYSSTASNVPTAGNLVAGELAINTADGKLFYKDSAGVVQVIAGKGGTGIAGGSTTQVQYNSSGSLAGSANFTFNGTTVTIANDASISGLTVGKGGGNVASNTAVGSGALATNSSGIELTAFGYNALNLSTGSYNSAFGRTALSSNTTGTNNTGIGHNALQNNTTGNYNTSLGDGSLVNNTTDSYNTAVGYQSLYSNTSGGGSVAVGYQAGYSATSGFIHAFGFSALKANTTGSFNNAFGYVSLRYNTTGSSNTAYGDYSLQNNTTASNNTAVGYQAGYSNSTGTQDTFIGYQAGYSTTSNSNIGVGYLACYGTATGGNNVCVGNSAGYALTSGGSNTLVGNSTGSGLTTGVGNTFVGNNYSTACGYLVTTGSKNTILGGYNGNQGGLDIRTASNYIVLSDGDGNPSLYGTGAGVWTLGTGGTSSANTAFLTLNGSSGTNYGPFIRYANNGTFLADAGDYANIVGGSTHQYAIRVGGSGGVYLSANATSWSAVSDARLKNVTGTYDNALVDIAKIEPIKFTWKHDVDNKPQVGVVAQSVELVVPEAIERNVNSKDDDTEYLSVRYIELIPLMIASIQELKAEIDQLKGK